MTYHLQFVKLPPGVRFALLYCHMFSLKARQHFGIAELDGMVYVLGGENKNTEVLLSMEVFDPHCNVWKTQPNMSTVRKVSCNSFAV